MRIRLNAFIITLLKGKNNIYGVKMVKRKDFVSDGLVTLRHKYVDDQLKVHSSKEEAEAASKSESSLDERKLEIYIQAKNDLEVKLHEQLAVLESRIAADKYALNSNEATLEKYNFLIAKFAKISMPDKTEEISEAEADLEKLRVEFFSLKAKTKEEKNEKDDVPVQQNNPIQFSIIHELTSLSQQQMFKMGLFFALPLILGIILGCTIIAWVIIFTLGR